MYYENRIYEIIICEWGLRKMKKYIKSEAYNPLPNEIGENIRYIVKKQGSRVYTLDAKDNHKGYTWRRFNGLEFTTLKDAKQACLQYMAQHNIDSDFPNEYFDFYKIIYDPDGVHYTEEQI